MTLADGQTADSVAVKADIGQRGDALMAQIFINPALHNAEQRIAQAGIIIAKRFFTARRPTHGELHRGLGLFGSRRKRRAFIQHHADIGTQQRLYLNTAFGRQHMLAAIEMALKAHPVLAHFGQFGQRHDLKTAAIGKYRPVPLHEILQTTQGRHLLRAGAQHQMVSVAQHNIGAQLAHLVGIHRLHRRRRADRHESRGANSAPRRLNRAVARRAVIVQQGELHLSIFVLFFRPLFQLEQAGIAIRIEAVIIGNSMRIGRLHLGQTGESRNQHKQGGARQMKIG